MDDKTLYTNIKKRRKELNMSQDTLARLSGYANRSAIARIESGEIDLPQSKIKAIADAYESMIYNAFALFVRLFDYILITS